MAEIYICVYLFLQPLPILQIVLSCHPATESHPLTVIRTDEYMITAPID